jgi:cytochrome subunit of sulfide dehydrogenase
VSASRQSVLIPASVLVFVALTTTAAAVSPNAAGCSGCHGGPRLETAIPPIRGRGAAEIVAAMRQFRSGERPSTVMGRITKGFSDDEIQAIAASLAVQR